MSSPVPSGLSHMTFVVADLDAMEAILVGVLGARKVYDSGPKQFSLSEERFFEIGEEPLWVATMQGEALPARSYNHVAFKIDDSDFEIYRARIASLGLDLRESRPRIAGEGRSLYFHDHDNHLFELHTGTLAERLAAYAAAAPSRT
ncbi:MAG: FosX/FosE/FosI family fosfomycin resistance hydrolase [Devosia sp.]|nr:FosX/FosE/FosI family fosfomycin resistance hydrolase [Devosia sp.]